MGVCGLGWWLFPTLHFAAVIFTMNNGRSTARTDKKELLRRESEVTELDHPQTSASIRNTEKRVCVLAILSSSRSAHARVDRFSLIGLGLFKFVCFVLLLPVWCSRATIRCSPFSFAYQYPPFPFFVYLRSNECNCPCLIMFVNLGTVLRHQYRRLLLER